MRFEYFTWFIVVVVKIAIVKMGKPESLSGRKHVELVYSIANQNISLVVFGKNTDGVVFFLRKSMQG